MSYVEGLLKSYLFYNESNLYSVLKIEISDTDESQLVFYEPTMIICGFFPKLETGILYRFYGTIKHHPKYGVQYDAERYERFIDNSYEGLIDYLSSGLSKGIGPITAKRIIDTLGLDALDKIANQPDVLLTVPKFNKKLIKPLHQALIENRQMESTLIWLYGFQISPRMAMKIFQKYGVETIDIIRENPYVLIDEVEGIGFKRADEIGLRVGFAYNSPLRIHAVIIYLLQEYANKYGDTYLEKVKLLEYTESFLKIDENTFVEKETIEEGITSLISSGKIIEFNDKIGLRLFFSAEEKIASQLKNFSEMPKQSMSDNLIESAIDQFEQIQGIHYTTHQKQAILCALNHPFSIITGGPGTGKTTIVNGIVHIFMSLHQGKSNLKEYIKLAAPTGKAAKRLSEATEMPAVTIHRLLGFDYLGHFDYDEHHPLEAKLLIIDEASMLDVLLARQLFMSLSPKTKIVIVGDENQLPSVGPGQVLSDLINSNCFPIVRLQKIHRQAADSTIIKLAYDILNQQITENILDHHEDLKYIRAHETDIPETIVHIVKEALAAGYDLWEDIEVLIPMYRGVAGIDHVNTLLQQTFNHDNQQQSIQAGSKQFFYHDKVMQLVNQPEDGIMNGDLGIITGILDEREMLVDFSGNIVKYNVKDFDNITLAYAISVHKSQGSEFKVVILPMVRNYSIMLKRKLLYTGVTRAKEKLVILGEFSALKRGILGIESPRKTFLPFFLSEENPSSQEKELTIEDFL